MFVSYNNKKCKLNYFNAFTDGSGFKNPDKKYGYSFIIVNKYGQVLKLYSCIINNKNKFSTSIIAELMGVLKCLQTVNKQKYYPLILYTDSQYIEKIYNKKAVAKVHKKIWENIEKEKNSKIKLLWIRGHKDNIGNIIADKIIRLCDNIYLQKNKLI